MDQFSQIAIGCFGTLLVSAALGYPALKKSVEDLNKKIALLHKQLKSIDEDLYSKIEDVVETNKNRNEKLESRIKRLERVLRPKIEKKDGIDGISKKLSGE